MKLVHRLLQLRRRHELQGLRVTAIHMSAVSVLDLQRELASDYASTFSGLCDLPLPRGAVGRFVGIPLFLTEGDAEGIRVDATPWRTL
jgi:hypothetical protein